MAVRQATTRCCADHGRSGKVRNFPMVQGAFSGRSLECPTQVIEQHEDDEQALGRESALSMATASPTRNMDILMASPRRPFTFGIHNGTFPIHQ